ncbi:tRNA guanosine(15) transglycosylase TgtA [Candidatus Bathyarchaeota archaeon]|nr:tRNA guanosine(15) transglycosylase TgtA [Candidatus Bathyarchaeota archaeon]
MAEFEVRNRDLLARIGRIKTKSGSIETPAFLPVINMAKQTVTPRELWEEFGCRILITNAYILKKQQAKAAVEMGIHKFLDFPGVIMTDSGAYQILEYGDIEATPEEIVRFQEDIGTDIATILDVPTGWNASREHAEYTVKETVKRARELEELRSKKDILWVGPIQGGRYLDLIAKSAKEMNNLPFDIHALGSPTPVMEQYLFDLLVDMIITAKMNVSSSRPFHLFGAGHPFMFALAVALGCDLFDSAAYNIFAHDDRYLTTYGTIRLEELEYLPCSCPVCYKRDPKDFLDMPKNEREAELTRHNLHVCFAEIRRIKQAIVEGRLWEYLMMRSHGHPSLLQAAKKLKDYGEILERYSPVSKRSGLFFFSSVDLARPEVIRHRKRLSERYEQPEAAEVLILLPSLSPRLTVKKKKYKRIIAKLCEELKISRDRIHVCFYVLPFGIVPQEISDIYPLSQYEFALPPDVETIEYVAQRIIEYVEKSRYKKIVMILEPGTWQERVSEICAEKVMKKMEFLRA